MRTSSALRSTLPTASPTSSRYWDRDTSRSSLISSSASHVDENKKTAVNDEETEGEFVTFLLTVCLALLH